MNSVIDISRLRAYDLETHKVRPGLAAPPIVVGSMAEVASDQTVRGALLWPAQVATDTAEAYLSANLTIVGANIAYDLACLAQRKTELLPLIFRALREGRVADVALVQALDAIFGGHLGSDPRTFNVLTTKKGEQIKVLSPLRNPATGEMTNRYALATVLELLTGRTDAKEAAAWRTSYALLDGVDLKFWPTDAREYPVHDTQNTLGAFLVQLRGWERGKLEPGVFGPARNFNNLAAQVEAAFCLQLGAAHGFRTDLERVEALEAKTEEQHQKAVKRYQKFGWIRDDGSEDSVAIKRDVVIAYGVDQSSRCSRCKGAGKICKVVEKECRGSKVKNRFQGCLGAACSACWGSGKTAKLGKDTTCKASEGGCDGTGFDLSTTPMLKKTATGGISTDRDVKMESGNEDLSDFGEDQFEKIRSTYLPYLRQGVDHALTLKPNVLLYTGRVSYSDPIQQFTRKGGVRQCVCARSDCYLCSTDYAAGELCTLGQVCIWTVGESEMVRVINETKDPGSLHAKLAGQMLGVSFEKARALIKAGDKQAKDFRQASKAGNFGFGGAMGSATFVLQKRKSSEGFTLCPGGPARDKDGNEGFNGIRFCILIGGADYCGRQKVVEWNRNECSPICKLCVQTVEEMLKPAFFSLYPEVKKYHEWVKKRISVDGRVPCLAWNTQKKAVEVLRWRGGCNLTAGANNGFQALLSDIGKLAYVNATRECYLGEKYDGTGESPLFGSRIPAFMHDEPLAEVPVATAHLAGPRIAQIMVEAGQALAPDVFWKAEPALMKWWDKDAEPVYADGKLILWEPEQKAA